MRVNDQRGSILVYSLLLLAFTITISLTMQSAALMEYKMSLYEHRSNQARELAESAAWMVLEEINRILRDDFTCLRELPEQIILDHWESTVFCEQGKTEISSIHREHQDQDSCTYSYTCSGSYKGAEKTLYIKALICFDEYYYLQIDADGNLHTVFSYRDFIDRGRFISFEETE